MAEPHVISALVRKRAELAGVNELECQRRRVRSKIEYIDGSLVMFGDEGNPNDIRPASKQHGRLFKTGHLKRMALDILREASAPISNKEIVA